MDEKGGKRKTRRDVDIFESCGKQSLFDWLPVFSVSSRVHLPLLTFSHAILSTMKAGLRLPPHYMHNGVPQSERYINDLAQFLCSPFPSSIIRGHPNQVAVEGPPEVWGEWWNSAWIDDEAFDLDGVLKAIISNDESLMQVSVLEIVLTRH